MEKFESFIPASTWSPVWSSDIVTILPSATVTLDEEGKQDGGGGGGGGGGAVGNVTLWPGLVGHGLVVGMVVVVVVLVVVVVVVGIG